MCIGKILEKSQAKFGKILGNLEQISAKSQANLGQIMGKSLASLRQISCKSWADPGHILGNSQANLWPISRKSWANHDQISGNPMCISDISQVSFKSKSDFTHQVAPRTCFFFFPFSVTSGSRLVLNKAANSWCPKINHKLIFSNGPIGPLPSMQFNPLLPVGGVLRTQSLANP